MLLKTGQIFQVLPPLPRPAVITGLILGAYQAMRTATPNRLGIQVAAAIANGLLDVAAISLERFETPRLEGGIGEERTEFTAIFASAGERGVSRPIAWWHKRFGDADT